MSIPCPIYGKAIYTDCLDCEEKMCKVEYYKKVVIGIDQSYANTGISIVADGIIKKVTSIDLSSLKSKSEKREKLRNTMNTILTSLKNNKRIKDLDCITCIIERIRLHSKGFLNMDYIKGIGALNSVIIDVCYSYGIKVYSVDTRAWKAQIIGTSKPKANNYGVPEEKWPTVEFVINKGFENSILIPVKSRKTKGTFVKNGEKYMYNNDAADSLGIALFGFYGKEENLQEET
jgi:Holliday junction resolvasome RuvABC endonuclease subunit|nr:MAG TPA: HOLLIDAY JUNCTION RESOLVASE [Caudoviricetes sp.]